MIAKGRELSGRMLSVLLLLAVAMIWHGGEGARSQQPSREERGSLPLSIHPDEGLRQIAHFLQKRQGDDRKAGALPDPVILGASAAAFRPEGPARRLAPDADHRPPSLPRATRLARAPPRVIA